MTMSMDANRARRIERAAKELVREIRGRDRVKRKLAGLTPADKEYDRTVRDLAQQDAQVAFAEKQLDHAMGRGSLLGDRP